MTELTPMYGYLVKKSLFDFYERPYELMFGHNAIEVYIDALNAGVVLVYVQMRDHD